MISVSSMTQSSVAAVSDPIGLSTSGPVSCLRPVHNTMARSFSPDIETTVSPSQMQFTTDIRPMGSD